MKHIGIILALLGALVCVISFVSSAESNTLLFIAALLLVAAVVVPCLMNWIKTR